MSTLTSNPTTDPRLTELAEMIRAYNDVTQKMQQSHDALQQQVVRLQQQLASTDAALQRSRRLAALGEMAAGIAHEIRNPLGAIQLYAGILTEDLSMLANRANVIFEANRPTRPRAMVGAGASVAMGESSMALEVSHETATAGMGGDHAMDVLESSAATARKIASAVERLNAIVTDVLTFSRDTQPRKAAVDVCLLFERVIESHQPAIFAAGVRINRAFEGSEQELTIAGDIDLLHQALLNLVRNAVDAMSELPAGRQRVLTLDAAAVQAGVMLTIRDTGPGIDPAAIDRIFNPFFTTRSTGTGLGLAIVHRIIDAHGGTVIPRNDHGAVFEITLPAPVKIGDPPRVPGL